MGFLLSKRTLGFKLETTAYSAETLAAANYNIAAYNINYDPDIAMKARKLARGDYSRDVSIAGKRQITISFSVDVHKGSSATSAPNYAACLKACGLKEDIGAGGINWITHAEYNNVPATIEVAEMDEGASPTMLVIKAHGAMGNAKFVVDNIGEPMRIDFEFKGVLNGITDRLWAARMVPTSFDTNLPEAVQGIGVTLFSEPQKCNTVTIDLGNDVQVYTDPSKAQGFQGARVVDRNPTLELDPDMELISEQSDFARWTGNTTGVFQMQIGDHMYVTAPAVQYTKTYAPGDREGHVVNTKACELKRGTSGNDELKIVHYDGA